MPMSSACVGKTGKRFAHRPGTRWLMSYAAGLGQSADQYFDTSAQICAHPLFPVCLEWPVILDVPNIEHAGGLEPDERGQGVHALHDLHIHRPLVPGEELFTSLTIIGMQQKKPGAFQSMRMDTVDAEGKPVFTTWQGSMLRGVDVIGGDRVLEPWPELPERATRQTFVESVVITKEAAHTYTECARIFNPIHTDRATALAAGLPDIILHGTASLAHGVNVVVEKVLGGDARRVNRIAGRFAAMVRLPDVLEVRVRGYDDVGCFFEVANSGGEIAVSNGYIGYTD